MSVSENIAVIVVVYNKSCDDSLTCQTLKGVDNVKVVIVDNSTKPFDNKSYCADMGWEYLSENKNIGLSKAYNKGIDYLASLDFCGYVCLFDDDSEFDKEYFEIVKGFITNDEKADILLPVIYSLNSIISPCRILPNMQTNVFSSKEEALSYIGNDISGINSAMTIRFDVFKNYRYDENIFLDGIDHKFLSDMKSQGKKISVMDYVMKQNFSGNEKPNLSSALNRFVIYVKDMGYIMQNSSEYKRLIFRRMAKLTLTYKSFAFVKKYYETAKVK